MPEYKVLWRMDGTTKVEAEDMDTAEALFKQMEPEDCLKDLLYSEVYDIEEVII